MHFGDFDHLVHNIVTRILWVPKNHEEKEVICSGEVCYSRPWTSYKTTFYRVPWTAPTISSGTR